MTPPDEIPITFDAHVDVDVVAVEEDDQVTVLLELVAPPAAGAQTRPPATVQVVLDRSASMAGDDLEAAKRGLLGLVDRLRPDDRFGVVCFDDEVTVTVPAGPLTDKPAVRHAIAEIHEGGCTNLSAGLLRGLQEARRVAGVTGASVLLLSDGHANAGETDPARLAAVGAAAAAHGVTTTTIGIGLGYDELLLSELARGGRGGHEFAADGDEAAAKVAGEVDGLLTKTVQAASLVVRPGAAVSFAHLFNDLPAVVIDGGIMVELGDLWAGESRRLVLAFDVPGKPGLGLAEVAELTVRYVAVPGLVERTVTLPVHVNVVPGDGRPGGSRIPSSGRSSSTSRPRRPSGAPPTPCATVTRRAPPRRCGPRRPPWRAPRRRLTWPTRRKCWTSSAAASSRARRTGRRSSAGWTASERAGSVVVEPS